MKKALICGLSAAMLLGLVLIASNKPQADHPNEPDPTPIPSAVQTELAETPEPEETTAPINRVEQMSVSTTQQEVDTRRIPTDEELLKIFQSSYDFGKIFVNEGFSEEDVLEQEFVELHCLVGMMDNVKAPDDLEDQYMVWRAAYKAEAPVEVQPVQQPSGTSGNNISNSTGDNNTASDSVLADSSVDNSGALGGDITGGMNPNDFINPDEKFTTSEEYGHTPWDPSKVVYGN